MILSFHPCRRSPARDFSLAGAVLRHHQTELELTLVGFTFRQAWHLAFRVDTEAAQLASTAIITAADLPTVGGNSSCRRLTTLAFTAAVIDTPISSPTDSING
jgi:hypothetical protein